MHAHDQHSIEELKKSVRTYIYVFVTLMFLTFVTVAIASRHLPTWLAVTVALVIASIKGSLVALFFMHLISEVKAIYATLALCAAFFIVLMFVPLATDRNQSGIVGHNSSIVAGAVHAAQAGGAEHHGTE